MIQALPLAERVDAWLAKAPGLRPRSAERYAYSMSALVRSGFTRLDQLTRENVQDWLNLRQSRGTSASTAKKDLSAIKSFLTWLRAVERGDPYPILALLDLQSIKMRLPALPPPRWLSQRDEYPRLVAASLGFRPLLGLAVAIDAHTGLRTSELAVTRHEDYELQVAEPYVRVNWDNKTQKPRTAAIASGFAAQLIALGFPGKRGYVFPKGAGKRRPGTSAGPISAVTLERWLSVSRIAAGLQHDVKFLTLRHSYATWLVKGGCTLEKLSGWMGNGYQVCYRSYVGHIPGGDPDVEKGWPLALPGGGGSLAALLPTKGPPREMSPEDIARLESVRRMASTTKVSRRLTPA